MAYDEEKAKLVRQNELLQKSIEHLRNALDIQCSEGNWDYSPYMHGMANGMIYAWNTLLEFVPHIKRREFLEAPAEWLEEPERDE